MEGRILVTGAGGHLGANLVRRLLQDDLPVRALLQTEHELPAVAGLPVETMIGDLRHPGLAAAAVAGCTEAIHEAFDCFAPRGEIALPVGRHRSTARHTTPGVRA